MEQQKNEIMPDNPLIVHKEGDASYQPEPEQGGMTATHTETELEGATIERHRFKKNKKKSRAPYFIFLIILVAISVCAALYLTGTYDFGINQKNTVTEQTTRKSYVVTSANNFSGVITIKGTYVFYEGKEIDGVGGLMKELRYCDQGTQFVVQDEDADSTFLNKEIIPTLVSMKMKYDVKHIASSGLKSKYETTKAITKTTTKKSTTKKGE